MEAMLYTDQGTEFGREMRRKYREQASTKMMALLTFVTCAVLLLCASYSNDSKDSTGSGSTDSTDSTDTSAVATVVPFTALFARTVELSDAVKTERENAAVQAETNTYAMPDVTKGHKSPTFQYTALVGERGNDQTDHKMRVEYTVMRCLLAVYAKMIEPGNERMHDHAGLFGLLASDVCRSLLAGTHPDDIENTKTEVIAMHWYLRGKHDLYAATKAAIEKNAVGAFGSAGAFGAGEEDYDATEKRKRNLEAMLAESKGFLDAAFSLV
jgi:hypothetical protein